MVSPSAAYVLKAHGAIDVAWLQDCLALFKERQVCIRKLLLLKDEHPAFFSMLELHFTLPQADAQPNDAHSFLDLLNACLARQVEAESCLQPLN